MSIMTAVSFARKRARARAHAHAHTHTHTHTHKGITSFLLILVSALQWGVIIVNLSLR